MTDRPELWTPEWDGDFEGVAVSLVNRNLWRCPRHITRDDAMQEAYVRFLELKLRYPRVVDRAHFAALYRTALTNLFHDFARSRTLRGNVVTFEGDMALGDDGELPQPAVTDSQDFVDVAITLAACPADVRAVALAVLQDELAVEEFGVTVGAIARFLGYDGRCRKGRERAQDMKERMQKIFAEFRPQDARSSVSVE